MWGNRLAQIDILGQVKGQGKKKRRREYNCILSFLLKSRVKKKEGSPYPMGIQSCVAW